MLKIRVAFVGYRDFCDGKDRHFDVHEFTSDFQKMDQHIAKTYPYGGGYFAEDVIGGLDKVLNLDFQSKNICYYLIADAPSHGKQYHDLDAGADGHFVLIPP